MRKQMQPPSEHPTMPAPMQHIVIPPEAMWYFELAFELPDLQQRVNDVLASMSFWDDEAAATVDAIDDQATLAIRLGAKWLLNAGSAKRQVCTEDGPPKWDKTYPPVLGRAFPKKGVVDAKP